MRRRSIIWRISGTGKRIKSKEMSKKKRKESARAEGNLLWLIKLYHYLLFLIAGSVGCPESVNNEKTVHCRG